jgi:hypothetical protein
MNRSYTLGAAGAIACAAAAFSLSGCGSRDTGEGKDEGSPVDPLGSPTRSQHEWHKTMLNTPFPKSAGCFQASHPATRWEEVPCGVAPQRPSLSTAKAAAKAAANVGNTADFSASVLDLISSATGSFPSASGVTSETGTLFGANCTNPGPPTPNTYSLQLNTNKFGTGSCAGHAGCRGWHQFIYSNSGILFMQYWLINYGAPCPDNTWTAASPGKSCFKNSASTGVPTQPITNLANLQLTGAAASGGSDSITLSTGDGHLYSVTADDSVLDTAPGWDVAEFNVFGDFCSSQANFNAGATIVVRTSVTHANTGAPSCAPAGFTAETDDVNLVARSCCPSGGASPAITFTETNAAGVAAPFCLLNDFGPIQTPLL